MKRVLVANRGEITVRIIRACRESSLESVAVFSDADERALHVRLADRAVRIGPPPARDSYLNIPAIIEAARRAGPTRFIPDTGFSPNARRSRRPARPPAWCSSVRRPTSSTG